jgi:DNA-binding transcriptional MerR regulator
MGEQRTLTADEAATALDVSRRTLERWRTAGIGPSYHKSPTGRVWYEPEALEDYRASCLVTPGRLREHRRGPS